MQTLISHIVHITISIKQQPVLITVHTVNIANMFMYLLTCLLFISTAAALCPEGWTGTGVDGQGCFHFLPAEMDSDWYAARLACEQMEGYLAEPETGQQMEFLLSRIQALQSFTDIKQWWIGLTDASYEGTWVWQHSMNVAHKTFWCEGHPSKDTDNVVDCVVLVTDEENLCWKDIDCNKTSEYIAPICQRDNIFPSTTISPTTSTPGCNNGWYQFGGHCYYIGNERKPWPEAEEDCLRMEAHLASVHSREENEYIQYLREINYGYSSGEKIWLGGRRNAESGVWSWSDGSLWDYDVWWNDKPGDSNCVSYRGDYMGWFTSECEETQYSHPSLLCKKENF